MPNRKQLLLDEIREDAKQTSTLEHDNSVICPICWIETSYEQLTIEHIVPQSAGGKLLTLTCRECNSRGGHDLDKHLAGFLRARDHAAGAEPHKAKLTIEGKELSANVSLDPNNIRFNVVGKASNPRLVSEIQSLFESGNYPSIDIKLTFDFTTNGLKAAVLRCAYLLMFYEYGYSCCLHPEMEAIRKILLLSDKIDPVVNSLVFEAADYSSHDTTEHSISPCKIGDLNATLVIVRLKRIATCYFGAFMPCPDTQTEHFIDRVVDLSKSLNRQKLRFSPKA